MDSKGLGLTVQSQGEAAIVRLRGGIVGGVGQRLHFRSGTHVDDRSPDLGRLHALEEDAGQLRNGRYIGIDDVLGGFLAPFQDRTR